MGMPLPFLPIRTKRSGQRIFQFVTEEKIKNEKHKIQIRTIGQENNLPTKTVLLIGQTGEGKTTLINGILNHLCNVQFEDNIRYIVKDEIGDIPKKSTTSQTEFITGYLVYSQPGMDFMCNLLLIDTPGLGDNRGKERQSTIKKQMEAFLRDDRFDVNELHCLGLVTNATTNKILPHVKSTVDDFHSLFGKDTVEVTNVLATNAAYKPKVGSVLEALGVDRKKMYPFDNGTLFDESEDEDEVGVEDEDEDQDNEKKWKKAQKQYRRFFADLMVSTPVSLTLTREVMYEKASFEMSLDSLRSSIKSSLGVLLILNIKEENLRKYEASMLANEDFECVETVRKTARKPTNCTFGHAHNCIKCNKTCVKFCRGNFLLYIFCPAGWWRNCSYCDCPSEDHKREDEYIDETFVKRKVTDTEMKARYTDAKACKEGLEKYVIDLEEETSVQVPKMANNIIQIVSHIKRINEICRKEEKPGTDHIHEITESIKKEKLLQLTEDSDKKFIEDTLNALKEKVAELKEGKGGTLTSLTQNIKHMCFQIFTKGKEAIEHSASVTQKRLFGQTEKE